MWTNCLIISTKKPWRETLVRPACSVRIFSQRNLRSSTETQSVIARDAVNQSVKFAATRSEFCQRQILHLSESAIYATSKWTTTSLSKTLKRSKLHQETKLNSWIAISNNSTIVKKSWCRISRLRLRTTSSVSPKSTISEKILDVNWISINVRLLLRTMRRIHSIRAFVTWRKSSEISKWNRGASRQSSQLSSLRPSSSKLNLKLEAW